MSHPIKTVLVVGLGSAGRRHVGIIKELFPDINIVVLRHRQCDKNDIDALGLYKCVTSIDKAIETNPQAAIIANPATKHIGVAEKLAHNGIHLLIEKPISDSSMGVQALINICNQNNVILMTGYNLRFLPSLIEFKKQLQAKKIGDIYLVRSEVGQYLPSWRPESDYKNGVSANKSLGGGVLLELSHEIDYLSWIFGPIKWVKSHVSKQSDLDIDVEDSANIILGFKSNDGRELISSLNIDFIRHDTTRKCFVIGEKGTLLWNGINGQVMFFKKSGTQWDELYSSKLEREYTYKEEIKSFFLSVETITIPSISGQDGLEVVKIIENIKESSNNNSMVFCS
jgi:predicted dehydrogenase